MSPATRRKFPWYIVVVTSQEVVNTAKVERPKNLPVKAAKGTMKRYAKKKAQHSTC